MTEIAYHAAESVFFLLRRFFELDEEWFDDEERREEHAEYIAKMPARFVEDMREGRHTVVNVKLLDTPRSVVGCHLSYNPKCFLGEDFRRPEVTLNMSATGELPLDSAEWLAGQFQVAIQIAKEIERKVV